MIEEQQNLGWSNFFKTQCKESELEQYQIARAFAMQKEMLLLKTIHKEFWLPLSGKMRAADPFTVGDWFLFDEAEQKIIRRLNRKSLLKRVTSAKHLYIQLAAANIDTVFIVSSCNDDFNLARLERYLTLAQDGGCDAVIILTKSDLCNDISPFTLALKELGDIAYIVVNALDKKELEEKILKQCQRGQTIALMGSSGVGKSTIVNSLLGEEVQRTSSIRQADSKGRHTTTHRSVHMLKNGTLLLDSPGIRELQLLSSSDAIDTVFDDIISLAADCKFRDCSHGREIGCNVQKAIKEGKLAQRRLDNYQKLLFESERGNQKLNQRLKSERKTNRYQKSNKVKYGKFN
ncbi:MAG: ribosome small subunit-dependent GTPase A [Alphaproteobacteria bacterium]